MFPLLKSKDKHLVEFKNIHIIYIIHKVLQIYFRLALEFHHRYMETIYSISRIKVFIINKLLKLKDLNFHFDKVK